MLSLGGPTFKKKGFAFAPDPISHQDSSLLESVWVEDDLRDEGHVGQHHGHRPEQELQVVRNRFQRIWIRIHCYETEIENMLE